MKFFFICSITAIFIANSFATTWKVGISRLYKVPSQVSSLVSNGDTIDIDAGVYESDVAKWTSSNLLIRGIGGMAHLKANGKAFGGKAIWVIAGDNTRLEFIEFSLCSVPDKNGAGIRQEGKNLTVSHCSFHDNENGILAGTVNPSHIFIEYSEFNNNGFGDGQSHNLYINNVDTLTFQYNYTHNASIGHELKSRAHVNFILYNRISDEENGTASRSLDLPNGGQSYIIGNIIEQGPKSQNSNIIGFGLEGLSNPGPHEVYAINNTIVNNRSSGSFFNFKDGTTIFKAYNNIMAGKGNFILGTPPTMVDTISNLIAVDTAMFAFSNPTNYDYQLTNQSTLCFNKGTDAGIANNYTLNPFFEYLHPNISTNRCTDDFLDVGAYEFCKATQTYGNPQTDYIAFPNPTSGKINFGLNQSTIINSVDIFNLLGRHLIHFEDNLDLDISGLKPGTYIMKINTSNSTVIRTIIKL